MFDQLHQQREPASQTLDVILGGGYNRNTKHIYVVKKIYICLTNVNRKWWSWIWFISLVIPSPYIINAFLSVFEPNTNQYTKNSPHHLWSGMTQIDWQTDMLHTTKSFNISRSRRIIVRDRLHTATHSYKQPHTDGLQAATMQDHQLTGVVVDQIAHPPTVCVRHHQNIR